MSKQYKYEALTEHVLIEMPREESVQNEKGLAIVDEKLIKPKVGMLISKGEEVIGKGFIIGETYIINEFAGDIIPDPNRTLVLLHYRNVGLLRKEIK